MPRLFNAPILALVVTSVLAAPTHAASIRFHWNGVNPVRWHILSSSGSQLASARTLAGSSDIREVKTGTYQVDVDAAGFNPYKVNVGDSQTLDFTPPVSHIRFRWDGENPVHWTLLNDGGRPIAPAVTTGSRDSDQLDLAADSYATRYAIRSDRPGFRDYEFTVSPNSTKDIEPEVGRLIIRRTKSPSLDWVLRDTGGSRLEEGHLYNGSTVTLDVAAGDYRLELDAKTREEMRITVRRYDATRIER